MPLRPEQDPGLAQAHRQGRAAQVNLILENTCPKKGQNIREEDPGSAGGPIRASPSMSLAARMQKQGPPNWTESVLGKDKEELAYKIGAVSMTWPCLGLARGSYQSPQEQNLFFFLHLFISITAPACLGISLFHWICETRVSSTPKWEYKRNMFSYWLGGKMSCAT